MVLETIRKKFANQFAVGIIDADKKEPPALNDYNDTIAQNEELTLRKDPSANHYILQVNHVMENFLLDCAKEIGYDMSELGIVQTLEGLKNITKNKNSQENPLVSKLVKNLKAAKSLKIMEVNLNYLKDHPYDASEEDLKKLFEE